MVTKIIKKMISNVKVVEKPTKQMYGYDAMNYDAAKKMGFPWPYGRNTVVVAKDEKGIERVRDIVHECTEKSYMDKGWPYWKAHKKAIAAEKIVRR